MRAVAQVVTLTSVALQVRQGISPNRNRESLPRSVGRAGFTFASQHPRDVHLDWQRRDLAAAACRADADNAARARGPKLRVGDVPLGSSRPNLAGKEDHCSYEGRDK